MRFMLGVVYGSVSLVLLLGFAWIVTKCGPTVFSSLYDLLGGDPDVLSLIFCGWLVAMVGGLWVWSARRRRGINVQQDRGL